MTLSPGLLDPESSDIVFLNPTPPVYGFDIAFPPRNFTKERMREGSQEREGGRGGREGGRGGEGRGGEGRGGRGGEGRGGEGRGGEGRGGEGRGGEWRGGEGREEGRKGG